MIGVEREHAFAQAMIAAQRLGPRLRARQQVVHDRRRDVVAVQRRFERRLVAAGLGHEKIALQDGVVQRRIGVDRRVVQMVKLAECGFAVGLVPVRRENRPVLAVGERDVAGGQPDGRVLHVRGRQRRVRVVRRRREAARERQQVLAFFVEHVLLLAIQILEREPVDLELGILRHPRLDGRLRNRQQLWIEPGARLGRLREQNLHLLALRVDLIVALILVVPQRREVPHFIGELADVVREAQRREQMGWTPRERALQRGILRDLDFQLGVGRLPGVPVSENIGQQPLEAVRNLRAVAQRRGGGSFGGAKRAHPLMILRRGALFAPPPW